MLEDARSENLLAQGTWPRSGVEDAKFGISSRRGQSFHTARLARRVIAHAMTYQASLCTRNDVSVPLHYPPETVKPEGHVRLASAN